MGVYNLQWESMSTVLSSQSPPAETTPHDQVSKTSMTKMLHNCNHVKCHILNILLQTAETTQRSQKRGCVQSDQILQFHAVQEVIHCVCFGLSIHVAITFKWLKD